jgi:hypothetical protein
MQIETEMLVTINHGVRQGCPLPPTLLNIYIDGIIEKWQNALKITTIKILLQ